MKIVLAAIRGRRERKEGAMERLAEEYVARSTRYVACEAQNFEDEAQMLKWMERQAGREPGHLILLDRVGEMATSEEFAGRIRRLQESGVQRVVFGIGPADGWSGAARGEARALLSFGPMTLPHELARVVAAEQIYRALTILVGHPYHSGH